MMWHAFPVAMATMLGNIFFTTKHLMRLRASSCHQMQTVAPQVAIRHSRESGKPRFDSAASPLATRFRGYDGTAAGTVEQSNRLFSKWNRTHRKHVLIYPFSLRALRVLRGELLLLCLLAGCTLGPDYQRPGVLTPDNYRFAGGGPAAESLADLPWWELFRDPVLQELIRVGLTNNYDLRTAVARVEEARAQIGVARSFLYPQINFNSGGTAEQVSTATDPSQSLTSSRSFQNWILGFGVTWEFDVFGRIRRQSEAATAVWVATEMDRRAVYISLISDIAQDYFTLRELDLELEISRRTVGINDETIQFYRNRLGGGVSNRLELNQAIANRSRTAQVIPDLERRIAIQENLINYLIGRNPAPIPRGVVLTEQYQPPAVPAGLPATLLERRPDVQSAEQLLVAANANIGAAKALFFPTFSLNSVLGSQAHDLSNIADKRAAIWSVSGGLVQPLFQGWRILSNYEATKARFDQALAQYDKAAQNGFREVADALIAIQKFEEARVVQEQGVAALQEAATLARQRYDAGLANYLEVLIADQDLYDQELLLARTRGEQVNSVVQLYRALGGGWSP